MQGMVVHPCPGRQGSGPDPVLAGAVPVVWGVGCVVQLATGTEADHRFHQVTGQGLLQCALWLWALRPGPGRSAGSTPQPERGPSGRRRPTADRGLPPPALDELGLADSLDVDLPDGSGIDASRT